MVIRLPGGSNSGGSGGGGAPSGSAGGSLTGTYPNPTIATIPSGATATTQTAADGSTKVATTAYVDTADALKANLASPTLTGTPLSTTAAQGTNTTQIATTAMVHSEAVLLATLASPTFTGTPTLPTGTIATTQATGDSSTKLATTAHVKALSKSGETCVWPDGSFSPFAFNAVANAGGTTSAINAARGIRFVCPLTGTLDRLAIGIVATSGNLSVALYDTGDASAGNRTKLYTSGSTAAGSANAYQEFTSIGLSVTAGVEYEFLIWADNNTVSFLKPNGLANVALGTWPSNYNVVPGGGTAKQYSLLTSLATGFSAGSLSEATFATGGFGFWFIGKIT